MSDSHDKANNHTNKPSTVSHLSNKAFGSSSSRAKSFVSSSSRAGSVLYRFVVLLYAKISSDSWQGAQKQEAKRIQMI